MVWWWGIWMGDEALSICLSIPLSPALSCWGFYHPLPDLCFPQSMSSGTQGSTFCPSVHPSVCLPLLPCLPLAVVSLNAYLL